MNSSRGVSLIVTFFILTIILAVVLSVSTILYSQIKIIGNIGDSVASFYAADSGIEKTLYYDRKVMQEKAKRGLCDICANCVSGDYGEPALFCNNCVFYGDDCDPLTCSNCSVSFDTVLNSEKKNLAYSVKAKVAPDASSSNLVIDSIGTYKNLNRAIEIKSTKVEGGDAPIIESAQALPQTIEGATVIDISVAIKDLDGLDESKIFAYIKNPDGTVVETLMLALFSGDKFNGSFRGTWIGSEGAYSVDIEVYDVMGNKTTKENI